MVIARISFLVVVLFIIFLLKPAEANTNYKDQPREYKEVCMLPISNPFHVGSRCH